MKYGVGIIRDLESGTSFLMQERGIRSVRDRLLDLSVKVPYWRPRHAERTPEELAVLQEH